jgi:hypothetical protein
VTCEVYGGHAARADRLEDGVAPDDALGHGGEVRGRHGEDFLAPPRRDERARLGTTKDTSIRPSGRVGRTWGEIAAYASRNGSFRIPVRQFWGQMLGGVIPPWGTSYPSA